MRLCTRARSYLYRHSCRLQWVSFPKSGRTWIRQVLEAYFAGISGIDSFDFDTFTPFLPVGKWRRAPGIHFNHAVYRFDAVAEVERAISRLERRRILFQVRDPRDVVVTYYFQRVRRFQESEAQKLDLADFVTHPFYGIDPIVAYMNAWFRAADRFPDFLLLRYEDFRPDDMTPFERIFRFLDQRLDEPRLRAAMTAVPDRTRNIEEGGVTGLDPMRAGEPDVPISNAGWRQLGLPDRTELLPAPVCARLDLALAELDPALGYSAGATAS